MNPLQIIKNYYPPKTKAYQYLTQHSEAVAAKAVETARNSGIENLDYTFIEESALLHDIGIFLTHAPRIGCLGNNPYIMHGILGREVLEKEGFPEHGLVCERHIGVGLTIKDIERQKLALPRRNMTPQTREEEIVCFADLFFSKSSDELQKPKEVQRIRKSLLKYGDDKPAVFDVWLEKFGYNALPQ